eukprot:Skav235360  [mRNA]  locus=scaffold3967:30401:36497:+ [translate_table: standard]
MDAPCQTATRTVSEMWLSRSRKVKIAGAVGFGSGCRIPTLSQVIHSDIPVLCHPNLPRDHEVLPEPNDSPGATPPVATGLTETKALAWRTHWKIRVAMNCCKTSRERGQRRLVKRRSRAPPSLGGAPGAAVGAAPGGGSTWYATHTVDPPRCRAREMSWEAGDRYDGWKWLDMVPELVDADLLTELEPYASAAARFRAEMEFLDMLGTPALLTCVDWGLP